MGVSLPNIIAQSQWAWEGADAGTVNVETPVVNVGVAGTGGRMKIRNTRSGERKELGFVGGGVGIGASLVPSPVNVSGGLAEMPGTGVIYRLPAALSSLEVDEIKGPMIMYEVGADWGVGAGGNLFLCGGSRLAFAGLTNSMTAALAFPAFVASCNSMMLVTGMTVTLLPVNAGLNVYVGEIF